MSAVWLKDSFSITTHRPPSLIESGGIFMKDAAVLAGLGTIGKSNLVITPKYGSRIRWRVLLLDHEAKELLPESPAHALWSREESPTASGPARQRLVQWPLWGSQAFAPSGATGGS